MLLYLQKFVKRLKKFKPLLNPPLEKGRRYGISFYLVLANILLVFFLILLSNVGVLPLKDIGDFGFFAVIFLILALYRPGWSFLFFIGTIALENINLAPESLGMAVRPYQFIGALTILAISIRLASKRLNFGLPKINWPDKAIIIFAVAGFISVLGAADKSLSLKYSIIIFSFAALYFLARLFIQNLDDVKKILPFFLSSSAVVILYGIWQNIRFMKGLSNFETMLGRPNATFTEADWLGMFLVLVLAVIYCLLFYLHKAGDNDKLKIFNFQFSIFNFQFSISKLFNLKLNSNFKFQISNLLLYLLLIMCYMLLILTVSRSAWLGAIVISIMYLVLCIWYFLRSNDKKILWIPAYAGMTLAIAFGIIAIFNLTNFELGNRLQSTGTKLQKITVSCVDKQQAKELQQLQQIEHLEQLEQFSCYHINLEDIEKEKAAGNIIMTVYRDDPNINIRSEIYKKSWEEIKKHPILGIGWGSINNILGEDERGAGLNSSNIFLEVWLGAGVIGLIAFMFVWGSIFWRAICLLLPLGGSLPAGRQGARRADGGMFQKTSALNKTPSSPASPAGRQPSPKGRGGEILNLFILLSFFAILIPNLFNAGIMLGFLWVWLAVAQIEITSQKNS